MQATSDLYRQILAQTNYWFETKVRINGVDYGEDVLFGVSTETAMFAGNPEIGRAIAGEIDVSLLSPDETIPTMAKVEPFVRVCAEMESPDGVSSQNGDLDLENESSITNSILHVQGATLDDSIIAFSRANMEVVKSEWLPKGVFYIDTRQTTRNGDGLDILSIHGYDAMLFGEQEYSETNLNWPAVDINIVREIAGKMGVELDERTEALMTEGYAFSLPSSYTLREVLGYIAAAYVGSFIMSEIGKLRLVSLLELPEETNYLIDTAGDAITFGGDRILV